MQGHIARLTVLLAPFAAFAQGEKPGGSAMGSMLPMMLVMFAIIYFFMIRPEQKKQKTRQAMLEAMKKGNKVVTSGGINGTVTGVKDKTVMVRVAEGVVLEFNKSSVSTVVNGKQGDTARIEDKKKG